MPTPPIPPLPRYFRQPDDRERFVAGLFDATARHYDRICRLMSFGTGQRYRRDALSRAGLKPGMRVLDVATGTGLVARPAVTLAGQAALIVGVDPSRGMLDECQNRLGVRLIQGQGERLPVLGDRFDFVTLGYALRHLADLDGTFVEFRRVLKPGGRLLILEITPPRSGIARALARAYFRGVVPLMARLTTGAQSAGLLMEYFWDTMAHCVSPPAILGSLAAAGFEGASRNVSMGIFSEYTARKPRG